MNKIDKKALVFKEEYDFFSSQTEPKMSKLNIKLFGHLLSNNPDDVLSRKTILIRKSIHPVFKKIIPLFAESRLNVVRREPFPKDKPIIFAATHGFKDDIPQSLLTIDDHVYLLFANLLSLYGSMDGIGLWMNGTIAFDRKDKDSRASSIKKIIRALELGLSVLMYPEGTWNKTPNLLVQKLFAGIYDAAKATGALVAPLATIQEGNITHSILDSPFDISMYEKREGLLILRDKLATAKYEMMDQFSNAKRSDFGEGDETALYWAEKVKALIATAGKFYDYTIENKSQYVDKNEINADEVFSILDNIPMNPSNAKILKLTRNVYNLN